MPTSNEKTPAAAKIDYALTEARIVLPGAQALLGFQFAIVVTTGFAELSSVEKALHGIAIGCIVLKFGVVVGPPAARNPHPPAEEGRIATDGALLICLALLFTRPVEAAAVAGNFNVLGRLNQTVRKHYPMLAGKTAI